MFGTKKYKVSATKTDPKGKKTTITISTDDENVVRKLLDQPKDFMDAEVKGSKQASKGKKKPASKVSKKEVKKKVVKALPEPKTEIPTAKQKIKINRKCFELIKTNPKIKYLGFSNGNHRFQFTGEVYTFATLPEAVKAFLNYEVFYENGEVKAKKLSGQPRIKPKPKHPATAIKKIGNYDRRNRYEFYNNKGEKVTIDISKITTDPKDKKSNPNLWVKAGYIKKPIYNYFQVNTYVTDDEGTSGKYNPTIADTYHLNFKWVLEATPENEKKLLTEVYRLANL